MPRARRTLDDKITKFEEHVTDIWKSIIDNADKNHSEAMGSMEQIKTMVKSAEESILEGMQQKTLPLPNQVDMLGTLLQKNAECLKAMCVKADISPKGNKIEKAQRLSALGSENAWNC